MIILANIKAFLGRKDIVISPKRYGIDALGAMAQGLFCSLLVGTIVKTLGQQIGLPFLVGVEALFKDLVLCPELLRLFFSFHEIHIRVNFVVQHVFVLLVLVTELFTRPRVLSRITDVRLSNCFGHMFNEKSHKRLDATSLLRGDLAQTSLSERC